MQGSPRDRWIAAALLVVCFVVYHLAPVHQLYDWRYITTVSHSLLHDGDLTIDQSLAELRAGDFIGEIAIVQFYSSALGPKQVAHNYRAVAVSS